MSANPTPASIRDIDDVLAKIRIANLLKKAKPHHIVVMITTVVVHQINADKSGNLMHDFILGNTDYIKQVRELLMLCNELIEQRFDGYITVPEWLVNCIKEMNSKEAK